MSTNSNLVDFEELSRGKRGEDLEGLARHLGRAMGLMPTWSGRGPDRGRDLTFTEILSGRIGSEKITWLVSCKDFAKSGLSVTPDDLPRPGIAEALKVHNANGFLLVTTTTVSSGAKEILDALDKSHGGAIHTQVWDMVELRRLLLLPENVETLKAFFPDSYKRVSGLTTLEGAVLAFGDRLPPTVLSDVLRLIRPYSTYTLRGEDIWPVNAVSAAAIDRVIRSLLVDQDRDTAVTHALTIEREALTVMSTRLAPTHPEECAQLLSRLIETADDEDKKFDAFAFLNETFTLSAADVVRLAPYVDDAESLIECAEIERRVLDVVCGGDGALALVAKLNDIAGRCNILDATVDEISYSIATEKRIDFSGELSLVLDIQFGGEPLGTRSVLGRFEGYCDADGVYVENAWLDDDSWD